jgi:hypothetical protein
MAIVIDLLNFVILSLALLNFVILSLALFAGAYFGLTDTGPD